MRKTSEGSANCSTDPELPCQGDKTPCSSGTVLKAGTIAPRDIIDGLPDEVLRWLHEGLDQDAVVGGLMSRRVALVDFESVVVDRLFPLRDQREFVVSLRRHCFATALAAAAVAELTGGARNLAYACGWLHEMGIAACVRHIDEAGAAVDDEQLMRLWPTICRSGAQHGIRLASRWRLPSSIRHAIREHATFASLLPAHPIVAIVVIAEQVASLVGCAFLAPVSAPAVNHALSVVGLGPSDVGTVVTQVERLIRHGALRPAHPRLFASAG